MVYRSPPKFFNSHGSEVLAEYNQMLPLAACTDVRPGNETQGWPGNETGNIKAIYVLAWPIVPPSEETLQRCPPSHKSPCLGAGPGQAWLKTGGEKPALKPDDIYTHICI